MAVFARPALCARRPARVFALGLGLYGSGCSGHRFASDDEVNMTVGSARPDVSTAAFGEASTSVPPALPALPTNAGESERSGEGSEELPPVEAQDGGMLGETTDDTIQTGSAPSTSPEDIPGETDTRSDAHSDTLSASSPATLEPSKDGHTDNISETPEPNPSADGGVTDVTTEATGATSIAAEPAPANRDELIAALPGCDTNERVVVWNADLIDFETTPDSALHVGALIVGDAGETLEAVLAAYQDDTGSSTLQWVSGADGTARALSVTNPSAAPGGGVALVVECLDASRFDGLEFWMRGQTPVGSIVFSVDVSLTQSASVDLEIENEWTRYRVPFNRLRTQGRRDAAVGGSLRALVWSSRSRDVHIGPGSDDWQPEPGAFEIAVDEIRFF